jgi:hypothetical protein
MIAMDTGGMFVWTIPRRLTNTQFNMVTGTLQNWMASNLSGQQFFDHDDYGIIHMRSPDAEDVALCILRWGT